MTSNNRVLVTGADGFIGSHLTEALVKKGYEVKAFVQYNSFNSWGWLDHSTTEIKQKIDIFSGDIRDSHGVKKAMSNCDYVLHLAALIAIPFSYHSPDSYVDTNIKGTLNILQAARELSVKKLIHTSTSEVYGTAKYVPIDENHPLQGQSPYSASKIGADQLVNSFFTSFDLPVMTLRPFNTYGPRQSARAIIPTIITQLLEGKEEIELGALEPTRDFSYISDTVNAFLSAIESNSGLGEVINIGSGFEISIGKVAELISDQMGLKLEIRSSKNRVRPEKSEVERLWADNSKAKDLLSWSPSYGQIDGFAKGIQETIEWFSITSNLSTYKSNLYNI
jgi:dTDP-glucose 4,6-dehydratase